MRSLAAAVGVALLVGVALVSAQAGAQLSGQIFTAPEPLPDPTGSTGAWIEELKKAHRSTFARDENGNWNVHFLAFMKSAAGGDKVSLVFYDITKGKPEQVHYIEFSVAPTQKTLKSSFKLTADDPIKAGNTYDVRLARIVNGQEDMLATVTLTFSQATSPAARPAPRPASAPVDDGPPIQLDSIEAAAPFNVQDSDLGRPYGENFQPIGNESLFSYTAIGSLAREGSTTELTRVDKADSLRANATAWGLASAGAASSEEERHVFRYERAFTSLKQIDDAAVPIKPVPYGALYYLARIYYGHSIEERLSEKRESFSAGVAATIKPGTTLGLQQQQGSLKLHFKRQSKGYRVTTPNCTDEPKMDAGCLERGTEAPIMVEYREIRSVARQRVRVVARFDLLTVTKRQGWVPLWPDKWLLNVSCRRNGQLVAEEKLYEGPVRLTRAVSLNKKKLRFTAKSTDRVKCTVEGVDTSHDNQQVGPVSTDTHFVLGLPHKPAEFSRPGGNPDVTEYTIDGAFTCAKRK